MRGCSFASSLTAKIRPGPGVGGGKLHCRGLSYIFLLHHSAIGEG
jgi:hypothetical protein